MMLVLYKNWLPGLCNTGILHCNLTSALLLIFFLLPFRQISLDCMFLESQSIIDYSMLLGIHFRAPEHLRSHLDQDTALLESGNSVARNCDTSISSVFVKTFELLFISYRFPSDFARICRKLNKAILLKKMPFCILAKR